MQPNPGLLTPDEVETLQQMQSTYRMIADHLLGQMKSGAAWVSTDLSRAAQALRAKMGSKVKGATKSLTNKVGRLATQTGLPLPTTRAASVNTSQTDVVDQSVNTPGVGGVVRVPQPVVGNPPQYRVWCNTTDNAGKVFGPGDPDPPSPPWVFVSYAITLSDAQTLAASCPQRTTLPPPSPSPPPTPIDLPLPPPQQPCTLYTAILIVSPPSLTYYVIRTIADGNAYMQLWAGLGMTPRSGWQWWSSVADLTASIKHQLSILGWQANIGFQGDVVFWQGWLEQCNANGGIPPAPQPQPQPQPQPIIGPGGPQPQPQPQPIVGPGPSCPAPVVQCPPPPAITVLPPAITVNVAGSTVTTDVSQQQYQEQTQTVSITTPPPPPPPPPPTTTPPPPIIKRRRHRHKDQQQLGTPTEMPVHWDQPGAFAFGVNAQRYRDELWDFLGIDPVVDVTTLDQLSELWFQIATADVEGRQEPAEIPVEVQ